MNLGVLAASAVVVAGLFWMHYRALRAASARGIEQGKMSSTYAQGYEDGAAITRSRMEAEIERRVNRLVTELDRVKAERDEAMTEMLYAFERGVAEARNDGRTAMSA